MAKLYFRYSAMDAGKTLDLLKVAYNYEDRGQHTLIVTSAIDKRAGNNKVKSRIGFDKEALSTQIGDNLHDLIQKENQKQKIACVLIDEIHFFSPEQILQLSDVVDFLNIPVICYGLRSDYRGEPFPAASTLLAIADTLEEVKTICHCGRKANFNMLVRNGTVIKAGEQVVVDDDNLKTVDSKYISVCRKHWKLGVWQ
ncbi:thymidine kinase [Aquella oligotrophica]|uniref:Thymidine kinase n=1 Tax=Aquella oligotrophica TaxID=2067065 RepID=A0A2I7N952_9NEIS|nr:thymidine kinase [Aquella oligotrophica]AUR52986.1 thymidine kinase [Aquella oligotrophica]